MRFDRMRCAALPAHQLDAAIAQLLDEAKASGIIKQALEQADAKGVQLAP